MTSRESILKNIRKVLPQSSPHPGEFDAGITFENPTATFIQTLESVGGQGIEVENMAAVQAHLAEFEPYASAKKVCSLADGVEGNVDLNAIEDPHELEDVDYAVLPGEFAVAENGAVWVTDAGVKHRVIYFIPQHIALCVPADVVLSNMHQAYQRLSIGAAGFGVFISGPSKTADIEQSLVIGAHGARSLKVFLVK